MTTYSVIETYVGWIKDAQKVPGVLDEEALWDTLQDLYDEAWNDGFGKGYNRGFVDREKELNDDT